MTADLFAGPGALGMRGGPIPREMSGKGERKMYEKGRAWIELNLEHLRHNVELFQKLLPKGCALMPAVKANAYGHGAAPIGQALQNMGIQNYCVASAEEGIQLREAGIAGQILVLGYTHPQDFPMLRQYGLTQTVVDYFYAKEMERFGKELAVHVGIDTGMHRLGEPSVHMEKILDIWSIRNLNITGVFSHLCTSDGESEQERAFAEQQEKEFQKVLAALKAHGAGAVRAHLQGSYGVLNGTAMDYDYARIGIALYGALSQSDPRLEERFDLRPVLSLKARIGCVKELKAGEGAGYGLAWHADGSRRIAAVSIGYADGIPRELSGKGHALVRGTKAPIAGLICMDQLLLDVTDVPSAAAGDEAIFIGESEGVRIKAEEMAAEASTISNEILSRLGPRLKRIPISSCP